MAVTAIGLSNENTMTVSVGCLLVGAGTLLPYIKSISTVAGGIETREPSETGALAAEVTQIRQEKPDPATIDLPGEDWWDGARFRLGEQAIESLLMNLSGALFGCEARVFLFDATAQRLMPVYRPPTAPDLPALGWAIGQGVTGAAYEKKAYVYATGDRTHDVTHGLDKEMQERYMDLTAVAAAPLFDRKGNVIGTLSLSSKSPATKLATDEGYDAQLALADQVSVCLVDLLRVST